jgi:methylmalonyl-CoA mutase cobalamin-binding domain/chain
MPHTILIASRRSGVSQVVIRAWERRYAVLQPRRCEKGMRHYLDEDIERLRLLYQLTQFGFRIGQIARLSIEELNALHEKGLPCREAVRQLTKPADFIAAARATLDNYDADKLRCVLNHALATLGHRLTLREVVAPMIALTGEQWREGQLGEAQEHLHTAVVRDFLAASVPGADVPVNAPEMIVTTPAGTAHELGALLVAATARDLGWRVTYLGAGLPASEIAKAAIARRARVVTLSLVYPMGCELVASEIARLRQLLPEEIAIIAGGRASRSYCSALSAIAGIHWPEDFAAFDRLISDLA